jgi:hypothetical protein
MTENDKVRIFNLSGIKDDSSNLSFIEEHIYMPFRVRRVYRIYDFWFRHRYTGILGFKALPLIYPLNFYQGYVNCVASCHDKAGTLQINGFKSKVSK